MSASAKADRAGGPTDLSQSSLSQPKALIPCAATFWDRWRKFGDGLYLNQDTRTEFEQEYRGWYVGKFGFEPDMDRAFLTLFPLWAAYRLGRADGHAD